MIPNCEKFLIIYTSFDYLGGEKTYCDIKSILKNLHVDQLRYFRLDT